MGFLLDELQEWSPGAGLLGSRSHSKR